MNNQLGSDGRTKYGRQRAHLAVMLKANYRLVMMSPSWQLLSVAQCQECCVLTTHPRLPAEQSTQQTARYWACDGLDCLEAYRQTDMFHHKLKWCVAIGPNSVTCHVTYFSVTSHQCDIEICYMSPSCITANHMRSLAEVPWWAWLHARDVT